MQDIHFLVPIPGFLCAPRTRNGMAKHRSSTGIEREWTTPASLLTPLPTTPDAHRYHEYEGTRLSIGSISPDDKSPAGVLTEEGLSSHNCANALLVAAVLLILNYLSIVASS